MVYEYEHGPVVTPDITNVGANEYNSFRFEGLYPVASMAYNSYLIMDEKIAVLDTVDKRVTEKWHENLKEALGSAQPDYLIVQHMEPDHSASILSFLRTYPGAQVVASKQAFTMMKQFFGTEFLSNRLVVTEGDTLDLGRHKLTFFTAPMVHWPEVIVTYDATDKVLFSADGFGKFGATDAEEYWDCEARRYYFGIVGKYGAQVQALLKKAATLDIQAICPLHGPVLTEELGHYIEKYDIWSSYRPEDTGVCIVYSTLYGNTEEAADYLERLLELAGVEMVCHRLCGWDDTEAVEDAFRYSHLVLMAPTYNNGLHPNMQQFVNALVERNFQNRTVAIVENGTWAPQAGKVMRRMLENCKDITYMDEGFTIRSALNEETRQQLDALLEALKKVR